MGTNRIPAPVRFIGVEPAVVTGPKVFSVPDSRAAGLDLPSFYEAHFPRLVGMLTLYCGDRELAAELAQEAMAQAWRRWSQVRHMEAPVAWVNRVAINLANSAWRRTLLQRRVTHREEPRREADVGTAVAVREAVSALPRRQRTALVLRYFADLPLQEVAELMKCSPETVRAHTRQAILNLRKRSGLLDLEEDE